MYIQQVSILHNMTLVRFFFRNQVLFVQGLRAQILHITVLHPDNREEVAETGQLHVVVTVRAPRRLLRIRGGHRVDCKTIKEVFGCRYAHKER